MSAQQKITLPDISTIVELSSTVFTYSAGIVNPVLKEY